MLSGSLDDSGVWGIHVYVPGSLYCSLETVPAFLINYTPIQNTKLKKSQLGMIGSAYSKPNSAIHLLAPIINYSNPLNLSFYICKMGKRGGLIIAHVQPLIQKMTGVIITIVTLGVSSYIW